MKRQINDVVGRRLVWVHIRSTHLYDLFYIYNSCGRHVFFLLPNVRVHIDNGPTKLANHACSCDKLSALWTRNLGMELPRKGMRKASRIIIVVKNLDSVV